MAEYLVTSKSETTEVHKVEASSKFEAMAKVKEDEDSYCIVSDKELLTINAHKLL